MASSHLARTASMKRSWLARLLRLNSVEENRRYVFEPLERRELMAVDLSALSTETLFDDTSPDAAFFSSQIAAQAEGEAAPDLVAFASLLRDAGVTLFGAAWDATTTEQMRLFEDGASFLEFVEVTNADRTFNSVGISEGIDTLPTWQFQNGSRQEGLLTLQQISGFSGITIPTSSAPFLNAIANQTVELNSPLHVGIDAYDPNGNPLTVSVSSSNTAAVTAEVVSGGRSARVSTNFGDMVFRLFEAEAPRAAGRFISLAQSGFYNTAGAQTMTFHRVVDGFVIQGGDPTGTGGGGSSLGDFDDQFNVNLQHNRSGVLSYAKSSDDTNDSQFFITEVATRSLDSNHSIFGQLIEGESVREAISGTTVNGDDKPDNNVIIQSVTIFDDLENGLIRLRGVGAVGSTSTITVTITDTEGNSTSRTFTVTVGADSFNNPPFLNDFTDEIETNVGVPVTVQLAAQDAEGDAVQFFVPSASTSFPNQSAVTVNPTTGLVTITPSGTTTGSFDVLVGVRAGSTATATDTQRITVNVVESGPDAPTSVDLVAASDSGSSNSDNITNATSLTFTIAGTESGATVELLDGAAVVGTATATGTTTTITTTNITQSGTRSLRARQTVSGETSSLSPVLSIVFDQTPPADIASGVFPASTIAETALNLDLSHAEEGSGLVYELLSPPAGATINASTGVFSWTPTLQQLGTQVISLRLTDAAGNQQVQTINIDVNEPPLAGILVRFVDTNGNQITDVSLGQTFRVQFLVNDLRSTNNSGVFSAFADLLYNSNLVELAGASPITYLNGYTLANSGGTSTLGLINELGGSRSSSDTPGPGAIVVAEISMTAKAAGQAVFSTESADEIGSDVSLYDRTGAVPIGRITYGAATLTIGKNFDATNDTFNVNEDSSSNVLNVLANDAFRSGQTGTLTLVSASALSAGGTASVSGNNILYTPAANYNGTETFTYVVRNQDGAEDTATVTVTVVAVNDPPVATTDSFDIDEDSSQNVLNVLTNDTLGADTGETLRVTAIGTLSQGGTATIGASGLNIIYTPRSGFTGTESFTYTISDGNGGTATTTVTINVAPAVPPPTAVADAFTVTEDAASASFNVLTNDLPSETGETLSITNVTAANGGTVSVAADSQSISYRPAANFAGTEIVRYTLRGSLGGTTTGTVTFTVTPVNDPPTAVDDTLTVLSQPNQTLNVLANDTNVDSGEVLRITAVSALPANQGTVSIAADGKSLLYTAPNTSFEGTVTFTYTLGDGSSLNDTATVALTVRNYVPRSIGGKLAFASADGNNRISGVPINVTGTTLDGETVSRTITSGSDGSFSVADLVPGNYTFEVPRLSFRGANSGSLTVNSGVDDGDSLGNQIVIGALASRHIDVRDFLGTSTGRGIGIAAQVGSTQQWLAPSGAWRGYKSISAALDAAGTTLTLSVTTPSNQTGTATVNLSTNKFVQMRASDGNVRYIRLIGEPADFSLPVPTAAEIASNGQSTSTTTSALTANVNSTSNAATNSTSNDLALQSIGDFTSDENEVSGPGTLDVARLLTPQL